MKKEEKIKELEKRQTELWTLKKLQNDKVK